MRHEHLEAWKTLGLPWKLLYHRQLLWHWPAGRVRAKCDNLMPFLAGCLSMTFCFWGICALWGCVLIHRTAFIFLALLCLHALWYISVYMWTWKLARPEWSRKTNYVIYTYSVLYMHMSWQHNTKIERKTSIFLWQMFCMFNNSWHPLETSGTVVVCATFIVFLYFIALGMCASTPVFRLMKNFLIHYCFFKLR